jgi:hypothetical protein
LNADEYGKSVLKNIKLQVFLYSVGAFGFRLVDVGTCGFDFEKYPYYLRLTVVGAAQ